MGRGSEIGLGSQRILVDLSGILKVKHQTKSPHPQDLGCRGRRRIESLSRQGRDGNQKRIVPKISSENHGVFGECAEMIVVTAERRVTCMDSITITDTEFIRLKHWDTLGL